MSEVARVFRQMESLFSFIHANLLVKLLNEY